MDNIVNGNKNTQDLYVGYDVGSQMCVANVYIGVDIERLNNILLDNKTWILVSLIIDGCVRS